VTCPYARSDAAYVLGALTPEERHQYEQHLRDCDTCTAAVREVAGLPGLLARLSADRVIAMGNPGAGGAGAGGVGAAGAGAEPPLPQTLLPRLLRQVRRDRRWFRLRVASAAAAVAAVVAAAGTAGVEQMSRPRPPVVSRTVALQAVGNHPLHGSVQLIRWSWGTTVRVTCQSEHGAGDTNGVYTLYVTDRSGAEYAVSSWRSGPEDVITVPGGISLMPDEVVSFRVRDDHHAVVMQGA
jgi:hypothetical protein